MKKKLIVFILVLFISVSSVISAKLYNEKEKKEAYNAIIFYSLESEITYKYKIKWLKPFYRINHSGISSITIENKTPTSIDHEISFHVNGIGALSISSGNSVNFRVSTTNDSVTFSKKVNNSSSSKMMFDIDLDIFIATSTYTSMSSTIHFGSNSYTNNIRTDSRIIW